MNCKNRNPCNLKNYQLNYLQLNQPLNNSTINVNVIKQQHKTCLQKQIMSCKKEKKNPKKELLMKSALDSERILVCVMFKFLLSRLMPTILDVVEHFVGGVEFVHSLTVTRFVDTSNLIVICASAANFLIFFTFSHSFRKFFRQYFLTLRETVNLVKNQCCFCFIDYNKLLIRTKKNDSNDFEDNKNSENFSNNLDFIQKNNDQLALTQNLNELN